MGTDITGVAGFDQKIYDDLVLRYTKATGKTKADLDGLLMAKINGSTSFKEAAAQIFSELPQLPKPIVTKSDITNWGPTLPSFGANYLAMITDVAAEQHRQNAERKAISTEEMIAQIKEQASTIRTKAVVQLLTGIVTGLVSIAQGCVIMRMSTKGGLAADSAGEAAKNNVLAANGFEPGAENIPANIMAQANSAAVQATQTANITLNNNISCFNSCATGTNSILGSVGQFIGSMYDAKLKEQEGNVERIRATQQQLESLDEALKALIQKAISSQDAIQQNMNQTRTRILG